jgi:hypothetical protein
MKKIYSHAHRSKSRALDLSHTYFKEVSDGIFYLQKDRFNKYFANGKFVTAQKVADAMNNENGHKIAIENRNGDVILNMDFIGQQT